MLPSAERSAAVIPHPVFDDTRGTDPAVTGTRRPASLRSHQLCVWETPGPGRLGQICLCSGSVGPWVSRGRCVYLGGVSPRPSGQTRCFGAWPVLFFPQHMREAGGRRDLFYSIGLSRETRSIVRRFVCVGGFAVISLYVRMYHFPRREVFL